MMNDDTLRNIEYLREKADVSYEEAANLLEKFDGNVMRVLVELERQGRVYPHGQTGAEQPHYTHQAHQANQQQRAQEAKKQATSFVNKALQHRVVVESGAGENKKTIANLSAPFAAGAAVVAPHLAIGSVALMFVLGYRVKVKKEKTAPIPDNVETFVDNTVSNIKKTANSFAETIRGDKPYNPKDDDDDNEGGEITIE